MRSAQRGGDITVGDEIDLDRARSLLGAQPLWLGREWNGLRLVSATYAEQRLNSGHSGGERVPLIRLTYARTGDGLGQSPRTVEIYETTTCVVNAGWTCTPRDPSADGTAAAPLGHVGPMLVRTYGLYVSIWESDRTTLAAKLALARALVPLHATVGSEDGAG
jgi:hypothetical protein